MYKLNYFNFKKKNGKYLITNDLGNYMFISADMFERMIKKEQLEKSVYEELIKKCFIYDENEEIFATDAAMDVRRQKENLLTPTSLHIFVVTKNCNFNCIYCQAGKLGEDKNFKMSKDIAKKSVDIALQSPSNYLTFEFQGGEPLLNFEIIKYIIEYSKENKKEKNIEYNLVSNLTLLTDEMMEFFTENNVSICTSIDGDRELQNKNRPFKNKDSYEETTKQFEKIKELNPSISAIETTTKFSLENYKEIVDTYIELGLNNVFIRPLTKLGKADYNWGKIGYSAEDFLKFYKNVLEYILEKNKEGINISEGLACILLKKILKTNPMNYMELRSPCGGAIGQLAYYYDGNIYTCDEGRMLAEMGDESFKIGNVNYSTYKDLMNTDSTKAMCISSCLECLPYCENCVYNPFCGTCPVINLAQDDNIFPKHPKEFRCKIYGGILDILFNYIYENDEEIMKIFENWVN